MQINVDRHRKGYTLSGRFRIILEDPSSNNCRRAINNNKNNKEFGLNVAICREQAG